MAAGAVAPCRTLAVLASPASRHLTRVPGKTCRTPPAVTNGFYTSSGNNHGNTVTYQCQAGYQLVGHATITCQPFTFDGNTIWSHWSGATPRCLSVQTCRSNPCQNGATCEDMVGQYRCHCTPGWSGENCELGVPCSTPPAVTNGSYSSSGSHYGDTVTYQCQEDFQLVGNATRTCQLDYIKDQGRPLQFFSHWSGATPRCLFARTCRSNPCQNGATCEDLVEQYRCHCTPGWSGQNCELDVQAPVVNNCPGNMTKYTSKKTLNVTWIKPTFSDPHGFEIKVESNYHGEWYEFPWGRFTVQYSAVKPSNGLRESCVFSISVLPHPCSELPAPQRGVMVCNGWQKELGRFCLASCLRDLYLPLGHSPATWHVCGATGHWSRDFPANVKCKDKTQTALRTLLPQPSSCDDTAGLGELASAYVDTFKASNFSSFCSDWASMCNSQNVDVICID